MTLASDDISVYTAERIGKALARQTFKGALCVLDRCQWPGSECDLLVVTTSLRVIDVEIKISRADLKADRHKDKWASFMKWAEQDAFRQQHGRHPTREECRLPRDWPRNCWKHYYVVAAPIWRDDLLEHCMPKSGVVTVTLTDSGDLHHINVKRRCTACKANTPLTPEQVVDIARLASLRMWDAYAARDRAAAECRGCD